jgi:hypothetical protein
LAGILRTDVDALAVAVARDAAMSPGSVAEAPISEIKVARL